MTPKRRTVINVFNQCVYLYSLLFQEVIRDMIQHHYHVQVIHDVARSNVIQSY